jgi:hypothetical protein
MTKLAENNEATKCRIQVIYCCITIIYIVDIELIM